MSKFNRPTARATPASVLVTEPVPSAVNHQGGVGYGRDAKTELFLLGGSNFVDEDTFCESGFARDTRYERLIKSVGLDDPEWVAGFLPYLRSSLYLRSAPGVGAAHFAAARAEAQVAEDSHTRRERGLTRLTTDRVCQRNDEPGESMAFWLMRYGRTMPKGFKRGLADAATRLYTGRSLLRGDSDRQAVRFADVIDLCHPKPPTEYISDVFHAALDRRHQRPDPFIGSVEVLRARAELMAMPVEQRRDLLAAPDVEQRLRRAGMTWKSLAGWLQGPMDAAAWAAILPTMSYMERLRNLRNFDEKGLPDELAEVVAADLADPERVAYSRQMPMRFLSAYRHIRSDRWAWPLEQALDASLRNIPRLPGRTLVLVDTSSSMDYSLSARSTLRRWDSAALFGLAVARRCEDADVVSFSWMSRVFDTQVGESLLRSIGRWQSGGYFLGGGTYTADAVAQHYRHHDRVLIVTDEQVSRNAHLVSTCVPPHVPLYTWNLAGHTYGHAPSGGRNRYVFGGLSDAAFHMVPMLERTGVDWPWM